MQVEIRLIGYLAAEGLPNGYRSGPINLPEGAKVADMLRAVQVSLPTPNLVVRENHLISMEDTLRDGDQISLIPPIGGGSGNLRE